jgi:hypothetical protein
MWFICFQFYLQLHRHGFEAEINVDCIGGFNIGQPYTVRCFGIWIHGGKEHMSQNKMFLVQKKKTRYFTSSAKEFAWDRRLKHKEKQLLEAPKPIVIKEFHSKSGWEGAEMVLSSC